ncbi:MAG: hypothetical protein IKO61_02230 [Lachnospiraceae bacterium]|nr:hypothetical protein [Lachnospiraceae bacterium]
MDGSEFVIKKQPYEDNYEENFNIDQYLEKDEELEKGKDSEYRQAYNNHMTIAERVQQDVNRQSGGDSEEMRDVKEKLSLVTETLKNEMSKDFNDFNNQLKDTHILYQNLIRSCDCYLKTKWKAKYALYGEGKRRRKMVTELREWARKEAVCFREVASNRELHSQRVNGMLVGNALGNVVRDYLATKLYATVTERWKQDEVSYETKISNEERGLSDVVIVSKQSGEKPDFVKNMAGASRLARFIGMEGICRRTDLLIGNNPDNKRSYGIRMEGIMDNQKTYREIKKAEKGKNLRFIYSQDAIRQLTDVKLFYLLLGGEQLDETREIRLIFDRQEYADGTVNYYVSGAFLDNIMDVFSSDMDGKGLERRLKEGKVNCLDYETVSSIMSMDPDDLSFICTDLLSKSQLKAFSSRLKKLQEIIKRNEKPHKEGEFRFTVLKGWEADWEEEDNAKLHEQMNALTGNGRESFLPTLLGGNVGFDWKGCEGETQNEKAYREAYAAIMKTTRDARNNKNKNGDIEKDYKKIIRLVGQTLLADSNSAEPAREQNNIALSALKRFVAENVDEGFLWAFFEEERRVNMEIHRLMEEKKQAGEVPKEQLAHLVFDENRELAEEKRLIESVSELVTSGQSALRNKNIYKFGISFWGEQIKWTDKMGTERKKEYNKISDEVTGLYREFEKSKKA